MSWDKWATIINVGGKSIKSFAGLLPTLVQEADVVVTGNPNAKRFDLYWVAVAAAFGLIRNYTVTGLQLPKGLILLEYNAEQNYVRFYCKQISTWAQVWWNLKRADRLGRMTTQIFGGPFDELKGGSWQWYSGVNLGGLPTSPEDFGKTGWEGETILTKRPVYTAVGGRNFVSENPSPPGDEQSRGLPNIAADPSVIAIDPSFTTTRPEYLLFQALSAPCRPNLSTPVPAGYPVPVGLTTTGVTPTPIPNATPQVLQGTTEDVRPQ